MVKPKTPIFILLLLALTSYSYAQPKQKTKRTINLGLECGTSTYSTSIKENDAIRATSSVTLFDQDGSCELQTSTNRAHYGIKAEFLSSSGYIGIATGLRYTQINSKIDREEWFDIGKSKFYILYNQDGTNTEYAQAEYVKQRAEYLGIPLDFRIFTSRPRFFRLFLMLGFDFNLKIADKTSINFLNTSMNPYEQQVGNALGKPSSFLTTFNPGLGFKLGNNDGVNVSFEVNVPSYIISTNASTFAKNNIGIGVQLNIYYPILK